MATVQYENLFPLIQPYVQGCPNVTIEAHLAEAAAEFCTRTQIWRQEIDADTTISGEALYEPDIPTGSALEGVLRMTLDDADLSRTYDLYEDIDAVTDKPRKFAVFQDKYIRFYPIPDGTYTFSAEVILKPTKDTSAGIEDFLYEAHGRTIVEGAIAFIKAIPDKLWTDTAMALMHKQKFEHGINEARVRDSRNVPLRVRARPFA